VHYLAKFYVSKFNTVKFSYLHFSVSIPVFFLLQEVQTCCFETSHMTVEE